MNRLALFLALVLGAAGTASPISKVLELLGGMEEKTKKQGKEADEAIKEADDFCHQRSDDLGYAIKTNTEKKNGLEASVEKSTNKIESIASTLQETSQETETSETELTKATEVREKEKEDFVASEKDLLDTMDSLKRAVGVLTKQAAEKKDEDKSESLLQVQQAPDIMSALEAMVSGSLISSADHEDLTAFLQSSQKQAPTAAPYESKKGGVVEMLEDLQDKAKAELNSLRTKENESRNSYQLLRQSLEDEIKFAKEEVKKLKATQAEESSDKSSNVKDLKETTTNLADDSKELEELTLECRRKMEDYELESKDRAAELEALATAKKALIEKTGGAEAQAYSFLQLGRQSTANRYHGNRVVQMLRDIAHKTDSTAISLLARRAGDMIREDQAAAGADPFAKIKTMISKMVSSMEKSLTEDVDHAQQCKMDMKTAKEKLAAKGAEVNKYQTRIDRAVSKSASLKTEVSELKEALSTLTEAQASATKIRSKESGLFKKNEPEIQQGLEGVKIALKALREYYGNQDQGAATGIVGMLEVVESDFAKQLAEMRVAESTAAEDFKKETQEMKLEKTRKEQDVKYKIDAVKQLDADLTELQSDVEGAQSVLDDAKEYAETVRSKCTVTPMSFEEKRAKRQQEIDDLKGALKALSSPTSFIQKAMSSVPRQLRGSHESNAMDN